MNSLLTRLVALFRRPALLAVFIMIFMADLVSGFFYSTFSLYASSLGATVALIGVLSGVVGLTRILLSVQIGLISDKYGRRVVMLSGMFLFALSCFLYAFNQNPYLLIPVRVLSGIVIMAVFFIGMTYVGDIVSAEDQGLVSGIYTTCMGLGFSLGSYLGGVLAASHGYRFTYIVAGCVALTGLAVGWLWLAPSVTKTAAKNRVDISTGEKLSMLLRQPHLLAASLGNLCVLILFDATIATFFPLYASTFLVSQAAIGTLFAQRALVSALIRLPTGVLTSRLGSHRLMVSAMVLGTVSIFSITFAHDMRLLTLLLMGEGICYGMYLTAGQAFINERFSEAERGTAMGIYSMTGSIGSMAGPFLLGAAANLFGLVSVFWISALLVAAGLVVMLLVNPNKTAPANADKRNLVEGNSCD